TGPGDLVAFDLPRGLPAACVILASFATGCGYLALDPAHPMERRRQILNQARPKVLVTTQPNQYAESRSTSAASAGTTTTTPATRPWLTELYLKDVVQCMPKHNDVGPVAGCELVDTRDTAYVGFTSGSTGHPKGVVISRGALS